MRNAGWMLLCLSLLPALSKSHAPAAESYRLDMVKTRVSFNIEHFGVPWVSAWFPDFSGDFVLDRDGTASRLDVSVQTATVDCTEPLWNGRLRSADWLDVQRYPLTSFHSTRVDFEGDGAALASGQLTLHGITQTVGLAISGLRCSADTTSGNTASGDSCSFVARTRIKRSDYGVSFMASKLGDDVEITLSTEAAAPAK